MILLDMVILLRLWEPETAGVLQPCLYLGHAPFGHHCARARVCVAL